MEGNKIMNPAFLFGTAAFDIAYRHKKYHSGTICKGVSHPHVLMHYLDVRKKRSRNEFEEDVDGE